MVLEVGAVGLGGRSLQHAVLDSQSQTLQGLAAVHLQISSLYPGKSNLRGYMIGSRSPKESAAEDGLKLTSPGF